MWPVIVVFLTFLHFYNCHWVYNNYILFGFVHAECCVGSSIFDLEMCNEKCFIASQTIRWLSWFRFYTFGFLLYFTPPLPSTYFTSYMGSIFHICCLYLTQLWCNFHVLLPLFSQKILLNRNHQMPVFNWWIVYCSYARICPLKASLSKSPI